MAHTYTCTNATGDIVGVVNTSEIACIRYSLSGSSAGSVEGNTVDGVYEKIGDSNIALDGYTGVVYVISGGRQESRILTHDAAVIGPEEIPNPDFDLPADDWVGNNANATMTSSGGIGIFENITDWTYVRINPALDLPAGTYLEVIKITAWNHTSTALHIGLGTGDNYINVNDAVGVHTREYVHTGGIIEFQVRPASGGTGTVSFEYMYVKSIAEENKYFINSVSQPVPALPIGTLIANETASIGYPDTVDTHYGDLVVHSEVITP